MVEYAYKGLDELELAYAITIHKSQGMTIDLLDVDLHGVFEVGMTYVALSRGVSMERMKLRNFSMRGIRTNPKWCARVLGEA